MTVVKSQDHGNDCLMPTCNTLDFGSWKYMSFKTYYPDDNSPYESSRVIIGLKDPIVAWPVSYLGVFIVTTNRGCKS